MAANGVYADLLIQLRQKREAERPRSCNGDVIVVVIVTTKPAFRVSVRKDNATWMHVSRTANARILR